MEIQNKEFYRVTSTAIIYNQDHKYLLLRRALNKKAFPGKWTVPGGGLEANDYINTSPTTSSGQWYFAIEKSLHREIKEEANIEVEKLKYLLDIVFIRPDGVLVIILSFYGSYKSGEIKLDENSIEYAWVTYEEAKNYDLIEGILEEIEMVDKILKGQNEDEIQYNKN